MSVEWIPPLCPLLEEPPSSTQLAAWVRLAVHAQLTPSQRRQLLRLAGSPEAVANLSTEVLEQTVGEQAARQITAPPARAEAQRIAQVLTWARQPGQRLLVYSEPDYPPNLRHLHDPPLLLYLRGNPGVLQQPMVALVGSRLASAAGSELAHTFAYELAQAGWCVVSGLARGIDTAAHQGALAAKAGAGTVAVMANGIDRVYPPGNLELARQITGAGAVLSELPLGAPSKAYHFPRRNRLVAALAQGVVVIEAAARSGSLITARLAAELGREVFAVPGSVHAAQVKGCHLLIREGAQLVESTAEILQALTATPRLPLAAATDRWREQSLDQQSLGLEQQSLDFKSHAFKSHAPNPNLQHRDLSMDSTPEWAFRSEPGGQRGVAMAMPTAAVSHPGSAPAARARRIKAAEPVKLPSWASPEAVAAVRLALGHDPASLDAILTRSGLPSPAVQTGLLALELAGVVRRLPDGRWEAISDAGP